MQPYTALFTISRRSISNFHTNKKNTSTLTIIIIPIEEVSTTALRNTQQIENRGKQRSIICKLKAIPQNELYPPKMKVKRARRVYTRMKMRTAARASGYLRSFSFSSCGYYSDPGSIRFASSRFIWTASRACTEQVSFPARRACTASTFPRPRLRIRVF